MKQIYNPYLPLDTYIPDGEPHVFNDRLYVFGSHDLEGGDTYCPLDYECWSAPIDDLSNWRNEGIIYKASQDPSRNERHKYMYAPDVVKGNDGRYYLYYALSSPDFTNHISVAVSDEPAGKYEYYGYVRNKDGSVFDRNITFDPGVLNDDGNIYLYYGWALSAPNFRKMSKLTKATQKKLVFPILERKMFNKTKEQIKKEPEGIEGANVVKLDSDMLTVIEGPKRIVPGCMDSDETSFKGHAFFEASSIRKIDGLYYFIYSSEYYHELCYAISKYPDRDFEYKGVLISSADICRDDRLEKLQTEFTTNNHGSLVEVNGKWYIFYHRHTHKSAYSRQGCAEVITKLEDGTFIEAEVTSQGLNGKPLKAEGSYPAAVACKIANGVYPYIGSIHKKPLPHITHNNDERFITEIFNNTRIVYKYFEFNGDYNLSLKIRGNAKGAINVLIDNKGTSTVEVNPNDDWHLVSTKINAKGNYSLGFDYNGEGSLDFIEFSFKSFN